MNRDKSYATLYPYIHIAHKALFVIASIVVRILSEICYFAIVGYMSLGVCFSYKFLLNGNN